MIRSNSGRTRPSTLMGYNTQPPSHTHTYKHACVMRPESDGTNSVTPMDPGKRRSSSSGSSGGGGGGLRG
ncbi:hypothetical protein F2P81_014064 [Scophthalmus maximus]|uniref:Uncharacterized protein n=1 Tax=Scophthalmus maximus TaxID=52904 RepID=A0A6A4SPD4_SCOMX|nr:hypothetical protein F2P81_014064 [Scophthalmus maximus]